MNRRKFIKTSLSASAGAALTWGFEERALAAHEESAPTDKPAAPAPANFPTGKISNLTISRLICGGNLLSGIAHSRDLLYVSPLLKHYFTEEKILDTLQQAENLGINTVFLKQDDKSIHLMNRYWNEKRGTMQWVCQAEPRENDLTSGIQRAVEEGGAAGISIQGVASDRFITHNQFDLLARAYEFIGKMGVIAGIGAHLLKVLTTCHDHGLKPDFFMKTFNSKQYWSAGPKDHNDSVWEEDPAATAEFMKTCETPWIAFKVLGAGAIEPEEGFTYAFQHGADFLCVGMFDFQLEEDIQLAKKILAHDHKRTRPWCA